MLAISVSLYAIEIEGVQVNGGMIWIGNAQIDSAVPVAPSPLTTTAGVSLPIRFGTFFVLSPRISYYGVPYGVDAGRVVPVEIEYADWAYVMGFLIAPRAVFDLQVARTLNIGAYASPTLALRVPARAWGTVDRSTIASYHYGGGRFFYPETGFYIDWNVPLRSRSLEAETINEGDFEEEESAPARSIHFVADFSAYFPLFHAWDGEGLPFWDQMMVTAMIGLRFAVGSPAE